MNADPEPSQSKLLCVVQIGFAGARRLYNNTPSPGVESQWDDIVQQYLIEAFHELRVKLRLVPHHFLCGISQIACGGDMVFTRACQTNPSPMPQRIFLPQPIDDYLSASGPQGPDFTDDQKAEAERLLASPHIIQERVVSHSPDRSDRFRETNAEILRVSDAVICLLREEEEGEAGGTKELLRRAQALGTPALEIRVATGDAGKPVCRNHWHLGPHWEPPSIFQQLERIELSRNSDPLPSSESYCDSLRRLVSTQAKKHQQLFKYAAALIIAAHILATLLATVALALHGLGGHAESSRRMSASAPAENSREDGPRAHQDHEHAQTPADQTANHAIPWNERLIPWLLAIELILLRWGFKRHHDLHESKDARIWANARVVDELARSIQALHPRHIYLEHFFRLPLPYRFRHLLRTLNVLHLRSTRAYQEYPWKPQRDCYLKRIAIQIEFYTDALSVDSPRLRFFRHWFEWFSIWAIVATGLKLCLVIASGLGEKDFGVVPQILGSFAVVFPVLAVAGLSWLAALDNEARVETFGETLAFLERQKKLVAAADTGAEFDRLVIETEAVLLGEVTNWFSRRANTGVT